MVNRLLATFGFKFHPHIPSSVNRDLLIREIADFYDLSVSKVQGQYDAYRIFSDEREYARTLGNRKTLSFEEAFVLCFALVRSRPETVVEIGTQYGKSTRRIIDMTKFLGLDSRIVCFDIVDEVKHFTPDEANLMLMDVTDSFREDVLEAHSPEVIFLDAHPYNLLRNTISQVVHDTDDCILAIHDCGKGLCNPNMSLSKENPNISSWTGVWERYVLADVFNAADPLDTELDDVQTATHRLKVFNTQHGLAVIAPNWLLQSQTRE